MNISGLKYTPSQNLDYTSFLIRIWREPPTSPTPHPHDHEWLVQIEYIPNGENRYFTSLDNVFAFIREQLP